MNIRFTNNQNNLLRLNAIYNPDVRLELPVDIRFIIAKIDKVIKHKKLLVKNVTCKQTIKYRNLDQVSYTFQNLINDILKIKRSTKYKYAIYLNEFNKQSYIFSLNQYR